MEEKLLTKQKKDVVPIDAIQIEERLRGVTQSAVDTLMVSMGELGQMLHPIQVQKIEGGYRLLDGMHRLTAAKALGWTEVPANIFTCNNHQAMRVEVEGNLAGAPLNPLDMGLFLAAQKRLYEEEFPHAKNGAKGLKAIQDAQNDNVSFWDAGDNDDATDTVSIASSTDQTDTMSVQSFAANAAEALGKDQRTIQRLIKAATALDPVEIDLLRKAPQRASLLDMQAIAKIGDPAHRRAACAAFSAGEAKTVRDAHKALTIREGAIERPKLDPAKSLIDAFARATVPQQRAFVEAHLDTLTELIERANNGPAEVYEFKARDRGAK